MWGYTRRTAMVTQHCRKITLRAEHHSHHADNDDDGDKGMANRSLQFHV
jgi:hypothetical protein